MKTQVEMMKMINETVDFIKTKTTKKPTIAIVLGSGLGAFSEKVKNADIINYDDIPNFPKSKVHGHANRLLIGEISGKCVIVMQGRFHYYEGHDTQITTLPVRVFSKLGCKSIILTNACGAVSKYLEPGDLMLIDDHLSLFCPSPLRGDNLDEFGPRFTDMSKAYTPEYIKLAHKVAKDSNINIKQGVYGFWTGPTYETASEIRAYAAMGCDVVGMSTVPETIVARHCDMKVLGVSCVTNMSCIYGCDIDHEEVIEVGKMVSDKFMNLIINFLKEV